MLKIISIYKDEEVEFEIEDDTDDFEQLSMELSMLIKYGYDSMRSAAAEGGAVDPDREAKLYVDNIVNEAINGDAVETTDADRRRSLLHIVDDYIDKNKKGDN